MRVIDFMPPGTPNSCIVRIVECLAGHVDMRTELAIRFDYGVTIPWVSRRDSRTLTAVAGPASAHLAHPGRHARREHAFAWRSSSSRKGETHALCPGLWRIASSRCRMSIDAFIALEETENYWRHWAGHCNVKGKWRKAVMRSLLTLKGLSYAPTGGIVAAVTTSLPEKIGGTRNWDYRYCWLRDATFTLLAFLNAGYREEARVWQDWLMRVIAGAPEQLQTMYSVLGEKRLDELELPHLPGYENSRPVRIGNAAAHPAAAGYLWRTGRCDGPGARRRLAVRSAQQGIARRLHAASGKAAGACPTRASGKSGARRSTSSIPR